MATTRSSRKKAIKKPAATKIPPARKFSVFHAFVFVLVIAFAGFLVYLNGIPVKEKPVSSKETQQKTKTKKELVKKGKTAKEKVQKREYEFYTILPDIEIEASHDYPNNAGVVKTKKAQKTAVASSSTPNKSLVRNNSEKLYQLQISAFKEQNKAESLRAELGMMGVQSNISTVALNNGVKMYRVRIGPTKDKKNLIEIRKILEQQNFKPFLQQSK